MTKHLTERGRQRAALLAKHQYAKGHSIREIAAETGRSYGCVHRLLLEAGVTLRPRGGPRPGYGLKPKQKV